ncbi:unnamed protein product [Diatraea saccharalis]|uniref:HAT C-terminal dimerisation domain-containing protein n=1 Tax=Diatraea saccharalis TaxID=40085 RepID=A0A9N9WBC6_9NEOP|nr:unnamed protein product [Diatraea saccharalis]
MDNLYSELIWLKAIQRKLKKKSEKSTVDKWQYILQNAYDDSFLTKCKKKKISYLFSIPATSALIERVFSLINQKWREERNRATIKLIKNELFIYLNINVDTLVLTKKVGSPTHDVTSSNIFRFSD